VTAIEWRSSPGGATTYHLVSIDPASGREAQLGQLPIAPWAPFAWLPGGDGFLVTGLLGGEGRDQVWLVTYPGLEAHRVTHDLARYQDHASSMSVTADGRHVVALQGTDRANIWIVDPKDPSNARPITAGVSGQEGLLGIDWTPDGELVCSSHIDGVIHIWTMKADGSERRPLTSGAGRDVSPAVSPDGRSIAFGSSTPTGEDAAIWLMDRDGGHLRRLTGLSREVELDPLRPLFFAPDGQWITFGNLRHVQENSVQVTPRRQAARGLSE
jgi:Tol biopolymer transport system component